MPYDSHLAGSPEEWLKYAKADLLVAEIDYYEDILLSLRCFHAQQAVEKAIKAVLIALKTKFPKTHVIGELIDLLPKSIIFPPALEGVSKLSIYAVNSRYPGDNDVIVRKDWLYALDLAKQVYEWAEQIIANIKTKG